MPARMIAILSILLILITQPLKNPGQAVLPTDTPTIFLEESTLSPAPEPASPTPAFSTLEPTPGATDTALALPTVTATSTTPPQFSSEYLPDRLLVKFRRTAASGQVSAALADSNSQLITRLDDLGVLLVRVPPGHILDTLAALRTRPEVLYAEPDYTLSALDTIPNDPTWDLQYNLRAIHAPQGWDYATGSSAITIAILDSGVDLSHPDLAGKLLPGYDFVNTDSLPQDDFGHGTHVAGIAAASANNGIGVAGVSWGARILPVKVLNSGGGGSMSVVAQGITWAADQGAQVINLSLGGSNSSQTLISAIDYAIAKGVIIVASAGNNGGSQVYFPARYGPVIAVGATDAANARLSLSAYGPDLDLMAPGDQVYSLGLGGSYLTRTGTSMSAPHVAGLAAILLGIPGNNSPALVEFQMKSTALDIGSPGWDIYTGYGLLQMDAALRLSNPPTATPTPTATFTYTPTPTKTLTPTKTPTQTPARRKADASATLPPILPPYPGPSATVMAFFTLLPSSVTPTSTVTAAFVPATDTPTPTPEPRFPLSTPTAARPPASRDNSLLYNGLCLLIPGLGLLILAILLHQRLEQHSRN